MSDPNVLPAPEDRRQAAAELAGSAAISGVDSKMAEWYRRMLTEPDDPEINAAAESARPYVATPNIVPGQTSLRTDYWKPATAEQIANAAARGFDLTQQAKYTSKPADK